MNTGHQPQRPDGSDAESRFAQWLHDGELGRNKPQTISGQRVTRTTRGFAIHSAEAAPQASPFRMVMVKEVFDDYLRCHSWDASSETEGTAEIYVAKDTALRNSILTENKTGTDYTYTYAPGDDVYNVVRTSDDGDTTEDQVVTPAWAPDQIIHAVKCKTGVWRTADDTPQADITDDMEQMPIGLLYMKPDRMWAGPKE